jgi:hypothetical protein
MNLLVTVPINLTPHRETEMEIKDKCLISPLSIPDTL